MKAAKHRRVYYNIISIFSSVVIFDLVWLWCSYGKKLTWSQFFQFLPSSCIGGIFIWFLVKVKWDIRSAIWESIFGGPNANTLHEENLKSQRGIKTCPYCGAEYAKEMTVCPLDQTALVLK